MALLEDMFSLISLDKEIVPYPFRVKLFGKNLVAVEGVYSIECFCREKVLLKLKTVKLEILGSDLKITKYGEGEVYLSGVIKGVNLL